MDAAHIDLGHAGAKVPQFPGVYQLNSKSAASGAQFHVHQWQANSQILHDHANQSPGVVSAQYRETQQSMGREIQLLTELERGPFVLHQPFCLAQQVHDLGHGEAGVGGVKQIIADSCILEDGLLAYPFALHESDETPGVAG